MQLIFSGKHNGSAECSIEHEDIVLQLDDWELNPEDIVIDEKLGEGAFGEVYKGIVAETHNNPHLEGFLVRNGSGYVALKFLKGNEFYYTAQSKTEYQLRGSFWFRATRFYKGD